MLDPFKVDQIEKALQPDKYSQCGICKKWLPKEIIIHCHESGFGNQPRQSDILMCPACDRKEEMSEYGTERKGTKNTG